VAGFLKETIDEADAQGAAAVVIELDTPGGLLTSTREITTAMLGAKTPIVVFVGPSGAQAGSAGFFLLMAADVAAMAPGTNAGAAHPVNGGGEDIGGTMGKKMEEDAAAQIRSLAARNGRNQDLAQKAVVDSKSYTAEEALQGKLIDLIAPTVPALLQSIEGKTLQRRGAAHVLRTAGAEIRRVEMSPLTRFLGVLADPNIAYLLLGLGWLGLLIELTHPGAILPGVLGGMCLILAFFALSVLPVDYTGVALILLAVIFFILEIKVTSYGMLTVAGVICLVLGSLMLYKGPEPALRVSLGLIAVIAGFFLTVVGFLSFMALRAKQAPVRTGKEGLLTEIGHARTALSPDGKVFIHGEIWNATADGPIAAGEEVEVVAVESLRLRVRPRRRSAAV
jgi:membrane-bound serine protease (ClpP class)